MDTRCTIHNTVAEAVQFHMKASIPNAIKINITTYSKEASQMERYSNNQNPKFICSICLNTKPKNESECKRKSQSCPICKRHCEVNSDDRNKIDKHSITLDDNNTKNVQTSNTDVAQGLNLLNEVLTVFQSKKHMDVKKDKNGKTVMVKDASVSTDCGMIKPKLTLSKIFQYSIDESVCENGRFSIVSSQPETHSQYSIDLIKHKSSSIPQMKMEELKNSLKEKTKSKDAIEEVNRMFATVKRVDRSDNTNRPQIRSGPRVLPVVKTNTFSAPAQKSEENCSLVRDRGWKCCETNYYLSSGDSLAKQECCHRKSGDERREKSGYMCCQYRRREVSAEATVCDTCKKSPQGRFEDECVGYL